MANTSQRDIKVYPLVNGPKQPLWLFVEGHKHEMEARQFDSDLR